MRARRQPDRDRLGHGIGHQLGAGPGIGCGRLRRARSELEGLDHPSRHRCGCAGPARRRRVALRAEVIPRPRRRSRRARLRGRLHAAPELVDQRRLAVDDLARIGRVALQLRAQPVVVGPERPRLLAELADLRLDPAEPGLRAPGPDLLGRVRPGDLRLDAALRRRVLAAAHAEPRGDRDQHHRRDDREQQQLAPPHGIGIARIAGRARPLRAVIAALRRSVSRRDGFGHRHREPSARRAGAGRRQPERSHTADPVMAPDGPGEARATVRIPRCRTRGLEDERREARTPPGLDERQSAGGRTVCPDRGPGQARLDRVSRQRLTPRHRAHQPDQRRDVRAVPGGRGAVRDIRQGLAVADQDLRRGARRRGQRQPVGEALLGADEQGDGIVRRAAGSGRRRGAQIEVARAGVVLDREAVRRAHHLRDPVAMQRDAVDAVAEISAASSAWSAASRICIASAGTGAASAPMARMCRASSIARAAEPISCHLSLSSCSKRTSPIRPASMRKASR